MSYSIAQDFKYVGNDFWRWWAWIEGDEAELDRIKKVTWLLHQSFYQNRVVSREREKQFRLDQSGWGTFLLRAELQLSNGENLQLRHQLRLAYPASEETATLKGSLSKQSEMPSVFLSFSMQDSRVATRLRSGLQEANVEVLDQTKLATGDQWVEGLHRMLERSDAVIGIVGANEISPWVMTEMEDAVEADKPALVLLAPGASRAGLPDGIEVLEMRIDDRNLDSVVESVTGLLQRQGPDPLNKA